MKSKRPVFAWLLVLIFFSIQVMVFSQGKIYDKTKQDKTNTQDNQTKTILKDDDSENMEQARYDFADQMAKNLMSKIDLSLEETEKVRDILIDYQENVLDVKQRFTNNTTATTNKTTDGTNNENKITDDNNTEIIGGKATNDKVEAYQDADIDANERIEGSLEVAKITQYNEIKKDWWAQIKSHVHSLKIEKLNNNTTNRNDAINPTTGSEK